MMLRRYYETTEKPLVTEPAVKAEVKVEPAATEPRLKRGRKNKTEKVDNG